MKPPPMLERSAEAMRTGAGFAAVDHAGFGNGRGVDPLQPHWRSKGKTRSQGAQGRFFRTSTYSVLFRHCGLVAARRAPPHAINTNQNLIGLVNRSAVSIHHIRDRALICPVAFILHERRALMVNPWYAAGKPSPRRVPA